jgi:hypothetical protein
MRKDCETLLWSTGPHRTSTAAPARVCSAPTLWQRRRGRPAAPRCRQPGAGQGEQSSVRQKAKLHVTPIRRHVSHTHVPCALQLHAAEPEQGPDAERRRLRPCCMPARDAPKTKKIPQSAPRVRQGLLETLVRRCVVAALGPAPRTSVYLRHSGAAWYSRLVSLN